MSERRDPYGSFGKRTEVKIDLCPLGWQLYDIWHGLIDAVPCDVKETLLAWEAYLLHRSYCKECSKRMVENDEKK